MRKILSLRLSKLSLIAICSAVSIIFLFWIFAFTIYKTAMDNSDKMYSFMSLFVRSKNIVRNISNLTDRIRLYVFYGDKKYSDSYLSQLNNVKNVENNISVIMSSEFPDEIIAIVKSIKQSSDKLLLFDEQAFKLYQMGDVENARRILFGDEYNTEKFKLDKNLVIFEKTVNSYFLSKINESSKRLVMIIYIGSGFMILISAVLLFFISFLFKTLSNDFNKFSGFFSTLMPKSCECGSVDQKGEIHYLLNLMSTFFSDFAAALNENILSSKEIVSGNKIFSSKLIKYFEARKNHEKPESEWSGFSNISINNIPDSLLGNELHVVDVAIDFANNGKSQLLLLKDSIESVYIQTNKLSSIIVDFSNFFTKIGELLNQINDLNEQINLLALNSSIEAARTGIAGNLFSQFSGDIKKLSASFQNVTDNIDTVLSTLQQDAKNAFNEIDTASKKVDNGIKSIEKTENILNSIIEDVNQIRQAAINTVYNSGQAENADNSDISLQEINSFIKKNNSTAGNIEKNLIKLHQMINELQMSIYKFKL